MVVSKGSTIFLNNVASFSVKRAILFSCGNFYPGDSFGGSVLFFGDSLVMAQSTFEASHALVAGRKSGRMQGLNNVLLLKRFFFCCTRHFFLSVFE